MAHLTIYCSSSPIVERRNSPKPASVSRFLGKPRKLQSPGLLKVVLSPASARTLARRSAGRQRRPGTSDTHAAPSPTNLCKNLFNHSPGRKDARSPVSNFLAEQVTAERRRQSCAAFIPNATARKNYLFSLSPKRILDSVQIKRLIGSGGFGCVYLGHLEDQKVAVKKLHPKSKNVKAQLQSFKAEVHAQTLRHPNVVRILAASHPNDHMDGFIVMEYVGDRHLGQILGDTGHAMTQARRISYALDLASALVFIHDNFTVHLDFKPANIFVTPYDTCKLGDFGCCQVIEEGSGRVSPTMRSYLTGTIAYRAPELLRGEPPTPKADIYSFGITLWEMTSRETPYEGQNKHFVIFGVVAKGLRPVPVRHERTDDLEECYINVYMQCWDADTEKRPTADALREMFDSWKNCM